MIPGDDMTEERWRDEADSIGDGWEPARFKVTGGGGGSFGWRKGSFGIFEGRSLTVVGMLELSSLTHLKSGNRVALFSLPEHAAVAGELAERIGDWSEIGEDGFVTDEWKKRAGRMFALWGDAGFLCGPLTTESGQWIWVPVEPGEGARLS